MADVSVGSVIEIKFANTNEWKQGTVTEAVPEQPNTFKIKMNDDGFDESLTYSLDKYEYRIVTGEQTTEIAEEAAEEVYEVEAITDKRYDDDGTVLYRVKWKGYPDEESTWEPTAHLDSAKNLVKEYDDKIAKQKAAKKAEKAARKRRRTEQQQPRKRIKSEPGTQQYGAGPTFWPVFAPNSNLDINECHMWTEEDISQWLNVFDFAGTYRQRFLDNAVDGRLLLEITFPVLFEELQITDLAHQHKFKTAITVLKQARQIKYGDA